jgi:hypothetical protein
MAGIPQAGRPTLNKNTKTITVFLKFIKYPEIKPPAGIFGSFLCHSARYFDNALHSRIHCQPIGHHTQNPKNCQRAVIF